MWWRRPKADVQMKTYNDLTVIIPTLNEKENIATLVNGLLRLYPGIHIVIAEGGSTDGTLKTAKNIHRYHRNVTVAQHVRSTPHGITGDVLNGLRSVRTAKTIVMDGDLQHPINKVRMIADKLDRYDMVIGARTTVRNWGLYRRAVTVCVTLFTLTVFTLKRYRTCNDMMSGFFGIRTRLFREVSSKNMGRYVLPGYKVMLDTLKLMGKDTRIAEVRYSTFHRRKRGISKANAKVLINIIRTCFR